MPLVILIRLRFGLLTWLRRVEHLLGGMSELVELSVVVVLGTDYQERQCSLMDLMGIDPIIYCNDLFL